MIFSELTQNVELRDVYKINMDDGLRLLVVLSVNPDLRIEHLNVEAASLNLFLTDDI